MKLEEYDIIELVDSVGEITKGTRGTILMTYSNDCYEIEFVNDSGQFIGIETVEASSLRKVELKEIKPNTNQ